MSKTQIKARTKPAPPPPQFKGGRRCVEHKSRHLNHWQDVLQAAEYPTNCLVLDFETYFDADYSMAGNKLSTIEYVTDERFEALGLAILDTTQPDAPFFYRGPDMVSTYLGCIKRKYGKNLAGLTVIAQNANFDAAILAFQYGIYPRFLIDTLGLARHWDARNKNDIGSVAKRLNLAVQKGDTGRFKGWTTLDRYYVPSSRKQGPTLPKKRSKIAEEQWPELESYALDDVRIEFEQFKHFLPRMSNPHMELRVNQHTVELFTQPSLRVDADKAQDLTQKMEAEIDDTVKEVGTNLTRKDLSGENSFEMLLQTALEDAGDDPQVYSKSTKKKNKAWMFAIAKADPQREQLEQHGDERVRKLMAARAAVKSWPLHIARINRIVNQAQAAGGYLPVPLKYWGAHTGRWSGGEKINLQNLGSRGHDLVNAVRELIIADEGKELVVADASQIEARVLAWIAGQWDLVTKFSNGEDVYCDFAKKVLGYRVRKPRTGDNVIQAVEGRHKWARNSVGKVGVLGCGYGMGPAKTVGYAGGTLDLPTAEKIVATYREDNDKIVQFWHDIERAFLYTFKYQQPCEMPRGLRFDTANDCDVIIILPNGRELKYHNVKTEPDVYGGERLAVYNALEQHWDHLWGGHLTENVVQAISRDILWEAIWALECGGNHVALHVHDELIAHVDKGAGEHVLQLAIQYLSTPPGWGPDLPLAAEGLITERYCVH